MFCLTFCFFKTGNETHCFSHVVLVWKRNKSYGLQNKQKNMRQNLEWEGEKIYILKRRDGHHFWKRQQKRVFVLFLVWKQNTRCCLNFFSKLNYNGTQKIKTHLFFYNFFFTFLFFYKLRKNWGRTYIYQTENHIWFLFQNYCLAVASICPTSFRPSWQILTKKFPTSLAFLPKRPHW